MYVRLGPSLLEENDNNVKLDNPFYRFHFEDIIYHARQAIEIRVEKLVIYVNDVCFKIQI